LYRLLLRAFPARIRRTYGDDMARLFARQRRELAGRPMAVAALWIQAVIDVLRHGLMSRWRARQGRGGSRRWIADVVQDSRYGLRMFARTPLMTAVMLLTLAVGIGASTAVFSLLDALAFRKLPVTDPDQLVFVDADHTIGFDEFRRLSELSDAFSSLSAVWSVDRFTLTLENSPGGTREVGHARVGLASAEYFNTLGVIAAKGRLFVPSDELPPHDRPIAVVSHAFSRRYFGRDDAILRSTLRISGVAFSVVGVAPRGFAGEWVGLPTDVWVPFMMASQVMPEIPGGPSRMPRRVLARLKPNTTIEQATAATRALDRRVLAELEPREPAQSLDAMSQTLTLEPAARGYSPQRRTFGPALNIVAAIVVAALVIGCANLANLLLARSARRRREMAVRLAMGASGGRLVRQLLTESAALACAGCALGVLGAMVIVKVLAAMLATAPVSVSGQSAGVILDSTFNVRLLGFALSLAALTSVLFGLAPALAARRASLRDPLDQSSARLVAGGRVGPHAVLVVIQVAMSLLLLTGAGLFLRTLANLKAQDLGFDRDRQLLVWTVPGQTGRQGDAMVELWRTVQERLSALPGVVSAAAANQSVLSGNVFDPASPIRGFRTFITPRYFSTLGVPLVSGREFTDRDTERASRVAIINESLARHHFGDDPAVGRLLPAAGSAPPAEVVGVVKDFVIGSPRAVQAELTTYFPYRDREAINRGAQTRLRVMLILVRTAGEPAALIETIRRELRAIDPELPIVRINTPHEQLDDVLGQDRLLAVLSSTFAVLAAFLASLGLFGLISYRVAHRTSEIGVRLALGASPRSILRMVVAESSRLVAAGLAVGLGASLSGAGLVASRLYGVAATDAPNLALAVALLVTVSAIAAMVPARRAARTDPTTALRSE
jgi:predicted permease